jgi:hypothetical protein
VLEVFELIKTRASWREERDSSTNRQRQSLRGGVLKITGDDVLNTRGTTVAR